MITSMRKGEVYYSPSTQYFMEVLKVTGRYHNSITEYTVKLTGDGQSGIAVLQCTQLKYNLFPDFELCEPVDSKESLDDLIRTTD